MGGKATMGIPLEDHLMDIMQSWQLPIEPSCERHLTQLIQQAAQRIQDEGLEENSGKLLEAETNFLRLLTEMTRQASLLGFHELHESTFYKALSSLCPIWPFC